MMASRLVSVTAMTVTMTGDITHHHGPTPRRDDLCPAAVFQAVGIVVTLMAKRMSDIVV